MKVKDLHEKLSLGQYNNEIDLPLDTPFIDNRGKIQNLWLANCKGVSYIESEKGSIRADHSHTLDTHASFIIEGMIEYSWEPLETFEGKLTNKKIFKTGEMFYTPAKVVHRMKFLEKTKFITISPRPRDHESHEEDVVRHKIIE